MNKLQKALNDLKKCHRDIRKELAKIEDSIFEEFFGEFHSLGIKQNMLKLGDGHVLYGVPKNYQEIVSADAMVLIGMSSPKLSEQSDFNPFTPLHAISHWRYDKRLQAHARSIKSLKNYGLYFMSWQQECGVHGKNDNHARKNHRLLVNSNRRLENLFQEEKETSRVIVKCCKNWADSNGRQFIVITNSIKRNFDETIQSLLNDRGVIHIKTGLRSKNYKIMDQISARLP